MPSLKMSLSLRLQTRPYAYPNKLIEDVLEVRVLLHRVSRLKQYYKK